MQTSAAALGTAVKDVEASCATSHPLNHISLPLPLPLANPANHILLVVAFVKGSGTAGPWIKNMVLRPLEELSKKREREEVVEGVEAVGGDGE